MVVLTTPVSKELTSASSGELKVFEKSSHFAGPEYKFSLRIDGVQREKVGLSGIESSR